jgi:hypothetical protein
MKFVLMCILTLAVSPAFAYLEAHWSPNATQYYKTTGRTYVVVGGEGFEDIGTQFAKAALAQARKIRDLEPSAQVILLIARGNDNLPSEQTLHVWAPDAYLNIYDTDLTGTRLVQVLRELHSIAGLYVFSHSTPTGGLTLESHMSRFSSRTRGIDELRFTSDAVAEFFGCNAGYLTASNLSHIWRIPVLGALTSTNFQELHTNGHFYGNDRGLYPSTEWSHSNKVTFNEAWSCPGGACLRMKTDNSPYHGVWGSFHAGLGFYKWFCGGTSESHCLNGMRKGATTWMGPQNLIASQSPTYSEVMAFIDDFFCPQDVGGKRHNACVEGIAQALETGNQNYTSFVGPSLQCNSSNCEVNLSMNRREMISQIRESGEESESSTMMDEVRSYLKAFDMEEVSQNSSREAKSCVELGNCLKALPL